MSPACCPTCGRTLPKQTDPAESIGKAVMRAIPAVNPSEMTDKELYAHYKRTALAEDLRFFLRGDLSPALRARAEAITKPTKDDLAQLRAAWRTERTAYERTHSIPMIGSVAWAESFKSDELRITEPIILGTVLLDNPLHGEEEQIA